MKCYHICALKNWKSTIITWAFLLLPIGSTKLIPAQPAPPPPNINKLYQTCSILILSLLFWSSFFQNDLAKQCIYNMLLLLVTYYLVSTIKYKNTKFPFFHFPFRQQDRYILEFNDIVWRKNCVESKRKLVIVALTKPFYPRPRFNIVRISVFRVSSNCSTM